MSKHYSFFRESIKIISFTNVGNKFFVEEAIGYIEPNLWFSLYPLGKVCTIIFACFHQAFPYLKRCTSHKFTKEPYTGQITF